MRYAYAFTGALLLSGAAAAVVMQPSAQAQTAQNAPGMIAATAPRGGAPMSFADMVARLQPAVVNISTTQRVPVAQQNNPFAGMPFGQLFGQQDDDSSGPAQTGPNGRPITREAQSLGSGFIISADGYVVTNNHVIAAGARGATVESIRVTLSDRREYTARLVGRDAASDLALLKIEATGLPFVQFGDSTRSRVGDWVVAIGNPFALGGTVTAGIISALHRVTGQGGAYDRFIQTDASINQGNSGGPMFNLNGDVIGINSQILSPTGGNVGIGFAIPAEEASPIIDTLRRGGSIRRGYLGVQIQPISDDLSNALNLPPNVGEIIARVEPGGAAARAGIRQGDVVTKVGGRDVTPDTTLSYLVANLPPGQSVPIEVIRDGRRQTINATVAVRPSEEQLAAANPNGNDDGDDADATGKPAASPQDRAQAQALTAAIGFSVRPVAPDVARQMNLPAGAGVVIGTIDPSSDAAGKGLQQGDVILSVNQASVRSAADLNAAITAARTAGRTQVALLVQRGTGPARFLPVRINAR